MAQSLRDRRRAARREKWSNIWLLIHAVNLAPRPTLGPIQLPSRWLEVAIAPRQISYGGHLTIHLHQIPRLRMRGAILPFLYTPLGSDV